jgi:hypothetical protein
MLAREYKKKITKSELLSRGWVYQEYLLSWRILSFSSSGPLIQCQHSEATSMLATGDPVRKEDTTNGSGDYDQLGRYTDSRVR